MLPEDSGSMSVIGDELMNKDSVLEVAVLKSDSAVLPSKVTSSVDVGSVVVKLLEIVCPEVTTPITLVSTVPFEEVMLAILSVTLVPGCRTRSELVTSIK